MIKSYTPPTRLESVSIILPVINETVSLRQSVETVLRNVKRELIREFIIVVCKRTTPEAMAVAGELQKELGELVVVLQQKLPFLGGALRDAFDVCRSSHVIIMGSDLETNPDDVHILIAEEQKNPAGIVTTSRWIRGGEFHGYSPIKLLCNWIFQRFFSVLYLTRLTDMTFGFRIMPTALANQQGNVNGQVLTSVNDQLQKSEAAMRQRYAQMGMSGSTMEEQDLAGLRSNAEDQVFTIGQQMATTGLQTAASLTGQDAGIYNEIMQAQVQQDEELSKAIAAFAGAMAK